MDLTIRDWMVIIGVLLIVAVFLDAWRRIRNVHRSRVKVNLVDPEKLGSERDADLAWRRELPNGGARVVRRGDLQRAVSRPGNGAGAGGAADGGDEDGLVVGVSATADGATEEIDWLDGIGATQESPPAQAPSAGKLPRTPEPEVFMVNVVARRPDGFRGEDILQILLACDLRFGDMNFFHRHEQAAGRGPIQFSVANMLQPGVFDLDSMAELRTPGLVFFLTLPGPEDMMQAYDYMLETAQAVARNLGGDLLDESRSVLTRQAMEHSRQRIRELERRLLAKTR